LLVEDEDAEEPLAFGPPPAASTSTFPEHAARTTAPANARACRTGIVFRQKGQLSSLFFT